MGSGPAGAALRRFGVGVVACGYADGYPRRAGSDTPVAIDGVRSRLIGRVSMDMLTVDLQHADSGVGSEVELFGDIISVNEVAAAAAEDAGDLFFAETV